MFKPTLRPPRPLVSILLPLTFFTVACSQDSGETAAVAGDALPQQHEVQAEWREDRQALGESTYQAVCAACHETGKNDAPRTGLREDWADRSDMWQAVLFSHAKSGYLDMPEKGGAPELTDEAVEAAAEYMLDQTFPELPKD